MFEVTEKFYLHRKNKTDTSGEGRRSTTKNCMFCMFNLFLFFFLWIRYKEGGEALLVLLPSEEKGMVQQLVQKKVPVNEIK